jgi:hypothetical protein
MTMTTESLPAERPPETGNPFRRELPAHVNAGTVAIEQERAIAEAQGALVLAKKFPRDEAKAYSAVIEACRRKAFAQTATYAYPRAGQTISGPSIRLAEELARAWGNINFGIRELSRRDGESEMEAYAWDLETNTRSSQQFAVRHVLDTRAGRKILKDERDIYELTANQGGRRLRSRILAIIPPDLVEAALAECRQTLAGDNTEPLIDRIRRMVRAFDKLGVPVELLARRLGHSVDETTVEELLELGQIHNSMRDGMTSASQWFAVQQREEAADEMTERLKAKPPAGKEQDAPTADDPAATDPAIDEGRPDSLEDVRFVLEANLTQDEERVNEHLHRKRMVRKGQTFRDLCESDARAIHADVRGFLDDARAGR